MLDVHRAALLLLMALLPWFWWRARHGRVLALPGASLRLIVAMLLILAAAGLQVRVRDGDMSVIYAIDRSASVPARVQTAALASVNRWSESMRTGDLAGAVLFGGDSALERALSPRMRIADLATRVPAGGTNIASALATARVALPPAGPRRIVLLSDGCETSGDAAAEAAFTAAAGIAIDVVIPDPDPQPYLEVDRVVAPPSARVGEPFPVSVEFRGRPGGRGSLTVSRNARPFAAREIVVGPDGTGSVSFTDTSGERGMHTFRASIRDELDDFGHDDDAERGAMVSVAGEPSVLFVTTSGARSLEPTLSAGGFRVTTLSPSALPDDAAALGAHDAIVFDDIAPDQVTGVQVTAVARFVEQAGGGLLVLGSPRTLDAAGDPAGPLAQLLPIDLRPRAGRRGPSMALAFIFDKSGSMADVEDGVPKIEMARAAALKILEVVPSSDAVGVIAFDSAPDVLAPMRAGQDPAALDERLRRLAPGGPTAIAPSIEIAVGWLQHETSVSRRHILLLSDGRTPPADVERTRALLRGQGIVLSVVSIGSDADRAPLEILARSTGGATYFPTDIRQLPLIVAREAARSAGGIVVDEPFALQAGAHPVLAGIDRATLPGMGGYVVSAAKPGAEILLSSHLDDPILAAGRAGLGKVAVYTADLSSAWSASFREWTDAPRLWSQTMRWLHRRLEATTIAAAVSEGAGGAVLTVDAHESDGRFISGLDVRATIRPPGAESYERTLEPVAPGRYQVPFTIDVTGPYVVSIAARDPRNGHPDEHLIRGFYLDGARERRACSGGRTSLTALADMTGGEVVSSRGPFDSARPPDYRDAAPWLSAAALLLFFVELTGATLRAGRTAAWLRRSYSPRGEKREQAA